MPSTGCRRRRPWKFQLPSSLPWLEEPAALLPGSYGIAQPWQAAFAEDKQVDVGTLGRGFFEKRTKHDDLRQHKHEGPGNRRGLSHRS